jgi:hypothetical protein
VQELDATPTGRSTVAAGSARLDGLLVDTALSATLTTATQQQAGSTPAISLLLAETAAITREDPAAGAHLLLALPRDWSPDVPSATAALDALAAAPWLRGAPLGALIASDPAQVDREPVRLPETGGAEELPARGLRQALTSVDAVRGIAAALTAPDQLLDDVETSAVAATSVGWRDEPDAWREQVDALAAAARARAAAVHVLPGSAVNVVSSAAALPVSVANELRQDVVAAVHVQSRSPRLVIPGDVEVRLAASSTQRVTVPVRALANGNTEVIVTVRAPDGTVLGQSVTIPVRVRADWETRGMLVAGAVLGVVLVAGLVRTIRRGRRRAELEAPRGAREPEVTR